MWIKAFAISSLLVAWGAATTDAQGFTQRGARRGAVAGAVVGGLIGGNNDRPALGIVVGGVSGALIGRAIGQQRDQQFYQNQYGYQNFQSHQQPFGQAGQGQYYYQQPSFQPHQQPYPHYQHYQPPYQQPLPHNYYQPGGLPSIQPPPQYNVPQYIPQQVPLNNEPLQAWPQINQPMSLNGGQPSNSIVASQLEYSVAPEFDSNTVSSASAVAPTQASSKKRNSNNANNSVLVSGPAPSLSGGVQTGQILTGQVQSGTILSGQYHAPTSLSQPRQTQGGAYIEAPRPANSNQPFRHGW